MPRIALIHSTLRGDEKLIIQSAQERGMELELIDIRTQVLNPDTYTPDFELALERCISTVKGDYAIQYLEALGIPVVNSSQVARVCEDKFTTSLLLDQAGVLTPKFALAFGLEESLTAVEQLGGFPVVLKPALGSWGRLLSKINDADALEALIEHKDFLGGPQHKAYYFQQYIKKPGRDIRAFVIGGETICAIYRDSSHWITNTARGGVATNCPVAAELSDLCYRASTAVGGGILAMDVFETSDGLSINEINHTMEFKNSEVPTGVSISGEIIEYCLKVATKGRESSR